MKHIAAAKFREHCLALLDRLDQDGIVITRHGKPVAKLIPYGSDSASTRAQERLRGLRGRVKLSTGPAALGRDRP